MGPVLVMQCCFINARGYFWLPRNRGVLLTLNGLGLRMLNAAKAQGSPTQ